MLVVVLHGQGFNPMRELYRWQIDALTLCNQQPELVEHSHESSRTAVIPVHDALGRVAPANTPEIGVREVLFGLCCDVNEKPAVRGSGYPALVCGGDGFQHRDTLLKRGSYELFVR